MHATDEEHSVIWMQHKHNTFRNKGFDMQVMLLD